MKNNEKNEAIANILGFERYNIVLKEPNSNSLGTIAAWKYPEEYKYLVSSTPMYDCPDFIKMLNDLKQIKDIARGWKI